MGTRFTGDSKDPEVNVTTWCLLVVVILAVFARLGTKYHIFHRFTSDDVLVIFSSVCLNGLSVWMNLWAASLLYITSLSLSKLSMVLFTLRLSPAVKDHRLGRIVATVVIIWAVVTILGTAFECNVPQTWDFWNGRCINMVSSSHGLSKVLIEFANPDVHQEVWHYFVCLSNMVTEALILGQAFLLIYRIHASFKKRLVFAGIFLPRVLVIGGIIGQLSLIRQAVSSNDPSYDICDISVIEEVVQCLSIVTACWGQLKPFLTWLKLEGRLQVNDMGTSDIYHLKDSKSHSKSRDKSSGPQDDYGLSSRGEPLVVSVTRDWEVDSQSSQTHIIKENQHPWMGEGSEPTIQGGQSSFERSK
ncbi:uncharacterized protein N7506_001673 [Penicillium brevicompactum]|uniref:uncharacterized protein n=1 Tax=Penicillium brevicompactum TaxID=5074 RepID=UPI002541DD7D|nr:uncharacterized protein N7506_001673 [Penicillium brevicompactum]KAJ5348420.1 hypothetical protein N7506_001673 [Penicillium brevicompactum]